MNILSSSAETWRTVFEFASIAGAVIALLSGAISVGSLIGIAITDRVIKRHEAATEHEKTVRLLTLEKETADAKRKLLETESRIAWRTLDENAFREVLETRPKGRAQVIYKKDDEEAYIFAFQI